MTFHFLSCSSQLKFHYWYKKTKQNKPCFCSNKLQWDSSKHWKTSENIEYRALTTETQIRSCMDKLTPWQNCLVKCHIDKMASPFLMSPWHREKPCTWAGIIYHHLPHRHIINTLTNVTRTNVTQANCHLDKKLPLDAMIGCPLSRQFFHLNKCHQDKCHLDKCPLDKSYPTNHAAQPSLIIRNTYPRSFFL